MKKLRLIPMLLALTLSGCLAQNTNNDQKPDGGDTPVQPDDGGSTPSQDVPVNSISVTPSSLTLTETETAQLEATVLPENATYEKVEWSTDDEHIASVDPDGLVSANRMGSTTIRATVGDKTATCSVTVEPKPAEDPVDYVTNIKLNLNSDFTSYENKTFVDDKISKVTLDYVEDGDTVYFKEGENSFAFRMAYIDCPSDIEEWGPEAYSVTKAAMQQAKTIVITNATLDSTQPVNLDSTGERYLGFVWYSVKENATFSDLRCLNLHLVYQGYSNIYNGAEDPLHGYFLYCLSSAQQAKLNMWKNYVAPENDYGYDHYDGYYGTLTWENGEDLKQKLHNIISKDAHALSYTWEVNQVVDHSLYDLEMLDVVYSDTDVYYSKTQTYWQREHVFPASLMTGKQTSQATGTPGRATDYHNLFAGESSGNSSRGNKNYGAADKTHATYTDRGVANGGYAFDPKNFEPGNTDKGRLARSIFYMDVMYSVSETEEYQPLSVVDEYVEFDSSNCKFAIGNKIDLLAWCTDSVDLLEMQHNELVYSTKIGGVAQNNRNPFVDYPGLIDYVYGTKQDVAGDIRYVCPRALDLNLENDGIQYYAIKTAKREAAVGDTYSKDDFTIVGIDNKFQEVAVDQSVAAFSNVQLTQIGTKKMTVQTDKNTIEFDVEVKQAEVNYSYIYEFSGDVKTDFGTNKIGSSGAGGTITSTLAGKQWNVTAAHETDMRKGSNDIGALFGFGTSTRPGTLTFETVESMTNVNVIKLVANTSAGQTMNVKISVGSTEVANYNLTGNSKESYEQIVELSSNLSGKVKIVMTPSGDYSVVVKTIAINEVK